MTFLGVTVTTWRFRGALGAVVFVMEAIDKVLKVRSGVTEEAPADAAGMKPIAPRNKPRREDKIDTADGWNCFISHWFPEVPRLRWRTDRPLRPE
jgi:hypothetical protein